MALLMMSLLALAFPGTTPPDLHPEVGGSFVGQAAPAADAVGTDLTAQGPQSGASSYPQREKDAESLGDFVGGRQVIFVAPYDLFLLFLLVGIVVLIIIL